MSSKFSGRKVAGSRIAVTNAGDGLSSAMRVDPKDFEIGEEVFVALRTQVTKVTFVESKDDPTQLVRVHTFKAEDATIIDGDLVAGALEAQQVAIEEATGIVRLDFNNAVPDAEDGGEAEGDGGSE